MGTNLRSLRFLSDMFRNIDKEVIEAVLLEYNGDLTESIEVLSEISGQSSIKKMGDKIENDLAIIACSLLKDESQPVGKSRIDIDCPAEAPNDLGSAAKPITASPHQGSYLNTVKDNSNSTGILRESPALAYPWENLPPPDTSINGMNQFSHKYFNDSVNDDKHWSQLNGHSELNESNVFNAFNNYNNDMLLKPSSNYINSHKTSNNLIQGAEINKLATNEVYKSFQNSPSTNINGVKSFNFNKGNHKINTHRNDTFMTYKGNNCQDFSSSVADSSVHSNKFNAKFCEFSSKRKPKINLDSVTSASVKGSDELDSLLSLNSNEWDRFYSNLESDVLDTYYQNGSQVHASENEQNANVTPSVTQNTAYLSDILSSSVNQVSNGVSMKNMSQAVTSSLQPDDSIKASSGDENIRQYFNTVSSLPAASRTKNNHDFSLGTTPLSCSQGLSNMHSGLNKEHDGIHKQNDSAGKLRLTALEFIPRPLAKSRPEPFAQNKIKQFTAAHENLNSDTIKPTGSPSLGKKKSGKAKTGKGVIGDPQLDNLSHLQPFSKEDVKTSTDIDNKKDIDPTDPLGWSEIFSERTSLVDPKPQRLKKGRKLSKQKTDQQDVSSVTLSPWQNGSASVAGGDKQAAVRASPPKAITAIDTDSLPPAHEKPEKKILDNKTESESGVSFKQTSIPQRMDDSPVSARLPPSLFGRTTPVEPTTKPQKLDDSPVSTRLPPSLFGRTTPAEPNSHVQSPENVSSQKPSQKVLMTPETRSQSHPTVMFGQSQLLKNKLQFRGVKTPVGVVRRYILEKQLVMIILRGLPGSGKSCLAKQLVEESQQMGVQGVVLSTDDYFTAIGQYCFDRNSLSDAHEWNKNRALQCIKESRSPVIIDNTNTTMWELLPYAVLALERNYDVQIFEPDTPWRMKVMELTRKNIHGVRKENIKKMKDRWENFTLDDVLKHASQSIASRKSPAFVPVDVTLTPQSSEVQQELLVNKALVGSEQVLGTTAVKSKDQSETTPSSFQDLGLSDWFSAQKQRSPKKKKKQKKQKELDTEIENENPKAEITTDFFNQSLKKAMVSLLKMPPPESVPGVTDTSRNICSAEQSVSSFTQSNVSIVKTQFSEESIGSDCKTPTNDKNVEVFGKMITDLSTGQDFQKEDTVPLSKVTSDALSKLRKNDVFNNSWSTTSSFYTAHSNSDVSSYHTVDGDEESGEGLLSDLLCNDDIEDIDLHNADPLTDLQKCQSQNTKVDGFSIMAEEADIQPSYFEQKSVISHEDVTLYVGNELDDSKLSESQGVEGDSNVVETVQDCVRNWPESDENMKSCTTQSSSLVDQVPALLLAASVAECVIGKDTVVVSETLKMGVDPVISNISGPPPLVEYSDSDDDTEQDVQQPQQSQLISPEKPHEHFLVDNIGSLSPHALENVSHQGETIDYMTDIKDSHRMFDREVSIDRLTHSSEDSLASGREQSPVADSHVLTDDLQPKKKKKHRVRKGRNPGPFIEDSLKMKSKTQNWSSFVVQASGISNTLGDAVSIELDDPKVDSISSGTQTDPYYFSIVYKLNSPAFNSMQPVDWTSSGVAVKLSSSYSTSNARLKAAEKGDVTVLLKKSSGLVDISTITDDAVETEELNLETLQSCFPEYSRKQLEATMAICQNDLEWVTSHLLDSPALYDMEDDEDDSVNDDLQMLEKGSVVTASSKGVVKSLANLCTVLVRKSNRIDADDLEMQVIQVGEGRLQKIERFGRSRLHTVSQEHLSNQGFWADEFNRDEYPLPWASQDANNKQPVSGQSESTVLKSSAFNSESTSAVGKNFATPAAGLVKDISGSSSEPESKISLLDSVNTSQKTTAAGTEHISESSVTNTQPVMPLDFVRQLEYLYGPLYLQTDDGKGIALDDGTARKIYNCLKLLSKKDILKSPSQQQLKNDEALARALQDEENYKTSSNVSHVTVSIIHGHISKGESTVPGWTGQSPSWMSQGSRGIESQQNGSINTSGESSTFRPHSVADTLNQLRGTQGKKVRPHKFQHKMPGAVKSVWFGTRRRRKVDSLLSIMQEEMAREEQQREQLRIIETTGDMEALATRIKRIELSHLFPSMGPDVLEDIFRSTGYSKEETVRVLQESYNIAPVPIPTDKEDILNQLRKSQEAFEHAEDIYGESACSDDSETTYDTLRNEARFYRQLALDCQQQAQRYHSDGMQGAALFYRQRAKKYKEDERAANFRAAQVLFEKGSERLQVENTLDLHFYHLDEAINAVNLAIEMKEDEYKKKPDKKNSYLDIVTGWGRNSKNGKARLKPAIMSHLWTKCFQYEERSPGMLRVYIGKKL